MIAIRFIGVLLAASIAAAPSLVRGQTPPAQSAAGLGCAGDCSAGNRFWLGADYLLWHVSGDRLPPLVTTSPNGTPLAQAGVLGNPATTVLFGGTRSNDGWRSGGRVQGGYWLDDRQASAVEAGFFGLAGAGTSFAASSATTPILARPFTDAVTGLPSSSIVAFPGSFTGQVAVRETSDLLGATAAWRKDLCTDCGDRISALVGYRFLHAKDRLEISQTVLSTGGPLGALTLAGSDQFAAGNNFHGADLGLEGRITRGAWTLDWLAKVAVGVTVSDVAVNGTSTITPAGGAATVATGGLLALSSNIGHFSSDRFAVAPAGSLRISYRILPGMRASVGYELLYWSNLVRPGGTIDTTVNPNLLPGGGGGAPSRPRPQLNSTSLLAHGLNIGLTIDF